MKALSIRKPLEFAIETVGESWTQGSVLKSQIKIKNTGETSEALDLFGVGIGLADIKKVHNKIENCFKIQEQLALKLPPLKALDSCDFVFEFKLSPNIQVSDKKSTFFLLFGDLKNPFHLQIPITPQPLFLEIIKLLDTFFRFKVKEFKGCSKGIEYKLIPPTSRDFSSVECLNLNLMTKDENLLFDFNFDLKKLDMSGIKTKLTKENKLIQKELAPKEYLMGKTHLDQDKLLKFFESVFSEVKHKEMF